jgi:hypothetical protein
MPLKGLFYYSRLVQEPTRNNNLFVSVFKVKTNVSKEVLFISISI